MSGPATAESAAVPASAASGIPLTPKSDTEGKKVRMKVFWKTARKWTDADIVAFQREVPTIASRLQTEQYIGGTPDGRITQNRKTCEDFAIQVLVEFAEAQGLPVKLTTGVRTYSNMEIYDAGKHDKFDSSKFGYSNMVMLTFGAPDMQKVGINTVDVATPEELLSGDILAQANDRIVNRVAHHVQMVTGTASDTIHIMQGNSDGNITRPWTTVMRLIGRNRADPVNDSYAGMRPEVGIYKKGKVGWDYRNVTQQGKINEDFLKVFIFYRWNFMGFNS